MITNKITLVFCQDASTPYFYLSAWTLVVNLHITTSVEPLVSEHQKCQVLVAVAYEGLHHFGSKFGLFNMW